MTATPEDVARFTNDGVLLTRENQRVLRQDPGARNEGKDEISLFFVEVAAGETIMRERFSFLSRLGRDHEALEFDETLGLGTDRALWPATPTGRLVDDERRIDAICAVRAYTFDMGTDRYAVEFVGLTGNVGIDPASFDSTRTSFDSTRYTFDRMLL